ncbi:DUF1310 family protein [Listeria monocytogenes]|uniref:DUF1310 family protein n=1 Tax=Listeria monocytogenes TaxID=1639 RepID=UPI00027E8AB3|nr:DUF1310 family protein [Listeria monocytogenes]EEP3928518.1 DUF1310 domain-containing protein [Listeria monocytogenes serotype 4ab]ALQ17778.1 hypothetical protein ATE43_12750 [Listeria monocytogenes]ALQ19333.1 hypothetical protein ATE44_06800 [Listeria monocytogenes]AYY70866.1 DUF1310 family protein [Listeria monocytogenes]EAC2870630.1 DUF1310 family protein [Listeria monocytogenes]
MKKRWIIVLGMTVITIFGLGVKFYMNEEKLNKEMINIVYSGEAKNAFYIDLKDLDTKAFTEEGVIQSYEIDEKSINHNPMGGINVTVIINENPELYIKYTLDKFNGKLECGSASIAGKLSKLLGRWEENK